jgi:hypothetical protein
LQKGKKFVKAYGKVRKFVNVKLASSDPKRKKVFENSTNGVVLGVLLTKKI